MDTIPHHQNAAERSGRTLTLIRDLLFKFEADTDWLVIMPGSTRDDIASPEAYHVQLMMDEGLLVAVGRHNMRLTSKGHDFLDAIRSNDIWTKTKSAAKGFGGLSLAFLGDIAKRYIKQELQAKLGITL